MTYLRHWIVEGKYLGKSEAKRRWIHEQRAAPIGYHFFCTECGRLWASCPVDGEKHMVWARPCADHSNLGFGQVPGTLHLDWDQQFVAEMPALVIEYEFLVHLRWAASSETMPNHIASIIKDMIPCFFHRQIKEIT